MQYQSDAYFNYSSKWFAPRQLCTIGGTKSFLLIELGQPSFELSRVVAELWATEGNWAHPRVRSRSSKQRASIRPFFTGKIQGTRVSLVAKNPQGRSTQLPLAYRMLTRVFVDERHAIRSFLEIRCRNRIERLCGVSLSFSFFSLFLRVYHRPDFRRKYLVSLPRF